MLAWGSGVVGAPAAPLSRWLKLSVIRRTRGVHRLTVAFEIVNGRSRITGGIMRSVWVESVDSKR